MTRKGAHVVIGARNLEKAKAAETLIRSDAPGASVEVRRLDLASLESVRSFAGEVLADHPVITVLVNNAGVMGIPRAETSDGFEMQFGVNHLGHFALTALLFPALAMSGDGRVVTVSSWARFFARPLDPDDPHLKSGYDPWRAYNQSKLANVHFAIELDRRIRDAGVPVRSLAADPGFSATDLQANSARLAGGPSQRFFHNAVRLLGSSPLRGALPQLRAATDPSALGGSLYGLRFLAHGAPVRIPIPKRHRDPQRLLALWELSERETGMRFEIAG
jgi:NAD(P)-dependent dehydrogenase (short-subunit alcohol dehydrogenase family)